MEGKEKEKEKEKSKVPSIHTIKNEKSEEARDMEELNTHENKNLLKN